jgi:hypothetical protein
VADAVAAKPRTRQGGGVADLITLGLLVGGGVILYRHLFHPNFAKVAALLKIPQPGVEAAWKFSRQRGLPFPWVLATILVESGGHPNERGDAGGRSVGLMQVNTVAHAHEIAAAGLTPESLLDPVIAVDWGTRVYKDIYDGVKQAIGNRRLNTPIDVTTRLAYKGPATVEHAIRNGQEPASISWAPEAIRNWQAATKKVAAAMA